MAAFASPAASRIWMEKPYHCLTSSGFFAFSVTAIEPRAMAAMAAVYPEVILALDLNFAPFMFRFSLVLMFGTCFIRSGNEATFSHFNSAWAWILPSAAAFTFSNAFFADW